MTSPRNFGNWTFAIRILATTLLAPGDPTMIRLTSLIAAFAASLISTGDSLGNDVTDSLRTIRSVGREGQGNEAAAKASRNVISAGLPALIPTLEAFAGSSATAKNWLRSSVSAIVDAESAAARPLPADSLSAFVSKKSNDPEARAIAFKLLATVKPDAAQAMQPTFIDDASLELRRDAISVRLKKDAENTDALMTLFEATRDLDQAEQIAKLLEQKGKKVDLTAHFGYFTTWNLCGPFDSTKGVGFAQSFPAEQGYVAGKKYPGKGGTTVGWKTVTTKAAYGMVDINKELGKSMDAVAYATVQFDSDSDRPCEVRVGSKNAVHIYLNGKKLFEREAYHHGYNMDQHVGFGVLKKGANEVVLKVVQNNQKENWAQDWGFNLRICDETGGKLPLKSKTASQPVSSPVEPVSPEVKK
ncbi:MAG: hypothetical protein U0798_19130 [Gemmataceae bacterium]